MFLIRLRQAYKNFFLFKNKDRAFASLSFLIPFLTLSLPLLWGNNLFHRPWIDISPSWFMAFPYFKLAQQAIQHGEWPLWNPYSGMGAPLGADLSAGVFTFFNWISVPFPPLLGWTLVFAFRIGFASLGFFKLARKVFQIDLVVALFLALLWVSGGEFVTGGNLWNINTIALIPWFFSGVFLILKRQSGFWQLALAFVFMLTGGGLLDLLLTGLFLGVFLIVSLWRIRSEARRVLDLGIAGIFGLGLSTFYLWPLLEMRLNAAPIWQGRSLPVFTDWRFLFFHFFRNLQFEIPNPQFADMNFNHSVSPLVAMGLFLFIKNFKKLERLCQELGVASLLFTLFYFLKLYDFPWTRFYNHWPLLKDIYYPKYAEVIYFSWHLLSALGFQKEILENQAKSKANPFYWALLPQLVLIICFDHWNLNLFINAIIYSTLLFAFAQNFPRIGMSTSHLFKLAVIVLFFIYFDTPELFSRNHLTDDIPLPFTKAQILKDTQDPTGPFRVFDLSRNLNHRPNLLAAQNFYDIRQYSDSLWNRYYQLFRHHALKEHAYNIYVLGWDDFSILNHDLLSVLGTKVVYRDEYFENSRKVNYEYHLLDNAFPKAWVTTSFVCAPNESAALEKVIRDPLERFNNPVIECSKEFQLSGISQNTDPAVIRLVDSGFNYSEFEVYAASESLLINNESHYPGWKVYVNDKESELLKANYIARAVKIPSGSSYVRFEYSPDSYRFGSLISLGFLLLGLLYSLLRWFRKPENSN
jgi:hypothetical protein